MLKFDLQLFAISIHAARMGCDQQQKPAPRNGGISIHAARMGCDKRTESCTSRTGNFNPRSPNGLRLKCRRSLFEVLYFNPRSPNGLRRGSQVLNESIMKNFNPRSPNGLRPSWTKWTTQNWIFQSTQPEWAATALPVYGPAKAGKFQSTQPEWAATSELQNTLLGEQDISIHAARMGCDKAD